MNGGLTEPEEHPVLTNRLLEETGKVFSQVLENAGVFKRDCVGRKTFLKFVDAVNK